MFETLWRARCEKSDHLKKKTSFPPCSHQKDYEGELAVVIGTDCRDVSEEDALDCVLGYTVCNDVSARCLAARSNLRVAYRQSCRVIGPGRRRS